MSRLADIEPVCSERDGAIEVVVRPRERDLGGFSVRRILPAPMAPRVGPFVFVDEMGPVDFPPGEGIQVRPHPHIGLATLTYLFDGEILHRDSLGCVQPIEPGAVNLMTAGRGIVHSERTSPERLRNGQRLHGMQVWMALPEDAQEIEPAFVHHPAASLPAFDERGVHTTVVLGAQSGHASPVEVAAPALYLAQRFEPGASFHLEDVAPQRAVYVVDGRLTVGDCPVESGTMAVLRPGVVELTAEDAGLAIVLGGDDIGPREMFWNFVHTSRERIEAAKQDWRDGRFDPVPGDGERIPLPGE